MPAISMRSVCVERGGNALLTDVSLDLPGDFVGSLIGPSGAGKTTALRLMNRMIDATRGDVHVDGRPISEHGVGELRRRVAMVFNEAHLLGKTVGENLRVVDAEATDERVIETLESTGLGPGFLGRRESELSAGEKHRVALARVLMGKPEMLLLDEVTSSLDPATAAAIIDTLASLRASRGLGIVLASHVFDHVRALGGECVVMIGGRVVERGATDQVFAEPRKQATRDYLSGHRGGRDS